MSEYYSSRGLVLRSEPWRDGDRLATVLTRDYGLLRLQIKSGLKVGHKLAGHLEPLTLTDITWARTRYGDTVIEASSVESFPALKSSLDALAPLLWGTRVLEKISPIEQPAQPLYALALERWWLTKNHSADLLKIRTLANAFLWQLLALEGLAPDISNLTTALPSAANCNPNALKTIRLFLNQPLNFWANKKIATRWLEPAESLLRSFIQFHLPSY